jgi:diketogulonate reductase-like aldo/keto reductase
MVGISNVNALQLIELIERAKIKPMAVQNRCYASRGWDRQVREICRTHRIMYQGFSLLTANPYVLRHPGVISAARRIGAHPTQVVFRFAMQVGMVPLTGTTNAQHMKEDLAAQKFELTPAEVELIETIEG